MNPLPAEYVQKEYEMRIAYLKDHLSRMWTRFNFFLTINTGLFVLSLGQTSQELALLGGIVGIVICLWWNQFSATDNYLVDVYRRQIAHAHYLLTQDAPYQALRASSLPDELKTWAHTGAMVTEYFDPADKQVKRIAQNFFQRRIPLLSATELGVVISLLYTLAWLGLLIAKL